MSTFCQKHHVISSSSFLCSTGLCISYTLACHDHGILSNILFRLRTKEIPRIILDNFLSTSLSAEQIENNFGFFFSSEKVFLAPEAVKRTFYAVLLLLEYFMFACAPKKNTCVCVDFFFVFPQFFFASAVSIPYINIENEFCRKIIP